MPRGAPGVEQFRRAITKDIRNLHIAAGIAPLIVFRQELVGNDELDSRSGMDDITRDHFLSHLVHCDRWRRRVTHNPEKADLGAKIENAIDVKEVIAEGEAPFGGDDIQTQSGGLYDLPWELDGTNPNIPVDSQLSIQSPMGLLTIAAIDRAIVSWTRLTSRDRTRHITVADSMRIYGAYQEIMGFLNSFAGDKNRVDVAQLLPSDEPLGPTDSPNLKGETANPQKAAN